MAAAVRYPSVFSVGKDARLGSDATVGRVGDGSGSVASTSYNDEVELRDIPLEAPCDSVLKTGDRSSLPTVYDANGKALGVPHGGGGRWLNAKLGRSAQLDSTLPMYKSYVAQHSVCKEDHDLQIPDGLPKLGKRGRRLLTVVLCVSVALFAWTVSSRMLNWVEDHRYSSGEEALLRDVEFLRLKQTLESMRVELNRLKEATYANSVALNGITNGAFKLPGSEEAGSKKQKFGKSKTPINQSSTSQNFDTREMSRVMGGGAVVPPAEVDLTPIVSDVSIR